MTQVQITKPAAKPAAAKPAKGAAKAKGVAAKPAAAAKAKPAAKGAAFYVRDGFRPGAGGLLFAYTFAWMQETGLIDGGSIPLADAVKMAGGTAIGYHTAKTGRIIAKDGAVSLAPGAANFFADRPGRSADATEAFRAIIRTGEPDGKFIKGAAAILPLSGAGKFDPAAKAKA